MSRFDIKLNRSTNIGQVFQKKKLESQERVFCKELNSKTFPEVAHPWTPLESFKKLTPPRNRCIHLFLGLSMHALSEVTDTARSRLFSVKNPFLKKLSRF